jgi:hypothetical protein
MPNMSLLKAFLEEFARKKIAITHKRTLRSWRKQRIGPPVAKFGHLIVYPMDAFEAWLRASVQQPARSRRTA